MRIVVRARDLGYRPSPYGLGKHAIRGCPRFCKGPRGEPIELTGDLELGRKGTWVQDKWSPQDLS